MHFSTPRNKQRCTSSGALCSVYLEEGKERRRKKPGPNGDRTHYLTSACYRVFKPCWPGKLIISTCEANQPNVLWNKWSKRSQGTWMSCCVSETCSSWPLRWSRVSTSRWNRLPKISWKKSKLFVSGQDKAFSLWLRSICFKIKL